VGLSKYPDYVQERLSRLSQTFNVPMEELWREFENYLKDPFVQTDPQFRTDDDRYRYVLELLWVIHAAQPPTETIYFIALGYFEPRITKGEPTTRIYGLAKKPKSEKLERSVILARGPLADLYQQVVPFKLYKLKVATMRRAENVFLATPQTRFDEAKPLNMDPQEFIRRELKVPIVRLVDVPNALSRKVDRYVDEFDWRGLVGIVVRKNFGTRPDGSTWAVYTVSDDSLSSDYVSNDVIVPVAFTVWVPYSMMKYDVDSKLFFPWDDNGWSRQGSLHERLPGLPDHSEASREVMWW
jgi:hypothetical protein